MLNLPLKGHYVSRERRTKKLAERIEKFRMLKNVQRKDIAAQLDMTVSGYSKIERGEVDITFSKIVMISKVLQIDLQELLNLEQTEVFHITNCNSHGTGIGGAGKVVYNNQIDEKINNYIALLEEENKRLKGNSNSK